MRLVVVRSDSATKQQPSRNWYIIVREHFFSSQNLYELTTIRGLSKTSENEVYSKI